MRAKPRPEVTPPAPWGVHALGEGEELELALGSLNVRMRRAGSEIQAAWEHSGDAAPTALRGGEPGGWTRWATARWDGRVAVSPALPERPVVFEPEESFHLLGGAEARIYVRVPLFANVEALGDARTPLFRAPTAPASDTWWGTNEEGELCYWLPTSARRTVEDTRFAPHLAMCPVHLANGSADSLPVEKIALRVAYLSLFADGARIWADETRVRYAGDAEGSELDVGGGPPPEAPGAHRLAEPRMRLGRGIRALTFARIRSLHGWI